MKKSSKIQKPYKGKRYKFIKKRKIPENTDKCFLCGKKGHWSKQCPNKRKALQHIVQMIDTPEFVDNNYQWTTSTQDSIWFTMRNHLMAKRAWPQLQMMRKIRYLPSQKLDMSYIPGEYFRRYINIVLVHQDKQIALTALVDRLQ